MKEILLLTILCMFGLQAYSQNLSDILDNATPKTENYTTSTFKGTRILNGHSIENRKKGVLEFIIAHRFGRVNTGLDELYGLDDTSIRFAFEYAPIDDATIGLGRSSAGKIYDAFFKYKILKQKDGNNSRPFTASVFGSVAYETQDRGLDLTFSQELTYVTQLLIARKFSPGFSLQLMPGYTYRNSVPTNDDPHGILSIGIGGRAKLTKRLAINAEYHYVPDPLESLDTTNSLALGLEIETGGHVFQIILSNSESLIESQFITRSVDDFFEGDIHLGFNITRAFETRKRKR